MLEVRNNILSISPCGSHLLVSYVRTISAPLNAIMSSHQVLMIPLKRGIRLIIIINDTITAADESATSEVTEPTVSDMIDSAITAILRRVQICKDMRVGRAHIKIYTIIIITLFMLQLLIKFISIVLAQTFTTTTKHVVLLLIISLFFLGPIPRQMIRLCKT
jgi:hypothetical protein